jgi:peptide/nickel transport system permease protein
VTAYVVRRLLLLPILLLVITFIVFCFARAAPGDPVRRILGVKGTEADRERITRDLGLDKPFLLQYVSYVCRAVRGDLGRSYLLTNQPVGRDLIERFPATVELTVAAMLLAAFFGVALGVLSAVYRGTWIDTVGMTVSLFGISIPVFWLGLLLILLLGGFLPVAGNLSATISIKPITHFVLLDCLLQGRLDAFLDALRHLLMPAVALATIPMAIIARITRSSMLEVLGADYVRTARAKGLPPDVVVMRHAFRNALIPVVTVMGTQVGYLLGGAVLTESVFSWPGLGTYVVEAVLAHDYAAMMGGAILIASTFVLVNLLVDILYAWIDPRIRYGSA